MRKTAPEKRRSLRILPVAVFLILSITVGLIFLKRWDEKRGSFSDIPDEKQTLIYNGIEYEPRANLETFLVMGLDKFDGQAHADSYNNDQQADLLMLLVFDNARREYSIIHINRDSMTNINILGVAGNKVGTTTSQIALAHTYGNGRDVSCRNTVDAVSELLLGIKVNHYISLKMDAVSTVNDLVGGVEIEVLDDFTGIDDTLVKGEVVTLMGEHALNYVRTRKGLGDSTNDARMPRQQQYVLALQEKLKAFSQEDPEFVVDTLVDISDYIVSDCSVTKLQTLSEKFEEYEFLGIKELDGDLELGERFIEFYPYEDSVTQVVVENFYQPISDKD